MKPLLYSVLIVFCLISCKGKEEKELPEIDVLGNRWRGSNDSIDVAYLDSLGVFKNANDDWMKGVGTGTISDPKMKTQPAQGIVITNAGERTADLDLGVHVNRWSKVELVGGKGVKVVKNKDSYTISIDTIPKKDTVDEFTIWHTEDGLPYLLLTETEYHIADSTGPLAIRQSGKWLILDCERALEVVYRMDSIKFKNKQ